MESAREEVRQLVVDPDNIDIDFTNFPYHIGRGLRDRLLYAAFLHFRRQHYASFVSELSNMSPKILLTGPYGSNKCQEAIVHALAKEAGSRILIYDQAALGLECQSWDDGGDELGNGS